MSSPLRGRILCHQNPVHFSHLLYKPRLNEIIRSSALRSASHMVMFKCGSVLFFPKAGPPTGEGGASQKPSPRPLSLEFLHQKAHQQAVVVEAAPI